MEKQAADQKRSMCDVDPEAWGRASAYKANQVQHGVVEEEVEASIPSKALAVFPSALPVSSHLTYLCR